MIKLIKKNCEYCGKEFNDFKNGKKKYCCKECYWKSLEGKTTWNKGIPQSKEAKIKTSKKLTGNKYPNRKRISEEDKDKIRQTLLKKYASGELIAVIPEPRYGKEHHNWKGGITSESEKIRKSTEYKLFRKYCFERDNFTCQISGQPGGELVVHHINNFADFPELRTSISNGITMTKELHKQFHKRYGVKNNTREQLEEFIENNIC